VSRLQAPGSNELRHRYERLVARVGTRYAAHDDLTDVVVERDNVELERGDGADGARYRPRDSPTVVWRVSDVVDVKFSRRWSIAI
jgi:hypothetical protein